MKKLLNSAIAIFVALLICSCSSVLKTENADFKHTEKNQTKLYSPAELKSDMDFLVRTAYDVHPSLYSAVDSVLFNDSVDSIKKGLTEPITRIEFYKRIAPLLTLLKNGHTGILFPSEEWNAYLESGNRIFPYKIDYDDINHVAVIESLDSAKALPIGTRITRINGLSADSLFFVFNKNIGGEREEWIEMRTSLRFRYFLWMYGVYSPFKIEYTLKNTNKAGTITTDGILYNSIPGATSSNKTNTKRYTFKVLPENIGYLNYLSMGDVEDNPFDEFLEKTFTELKSKNCKGLIIDLRKNGGGNSKYGDMLLSYITDKSYKMASKKIWKMSAEYKSYIRSRIPWWLTWVTYPPVIWAIRLFSEGAKIFTASDGEKIDYSFEPQKPSNNLLLFKGKVCFLIGLDTYSSAMMLSDAVSAFKLAELIGEETGGIPNEYGDIYQCQLPNTLLNVFLPTALFVRANGNAADRKGVLPDLEVKQQPEDTANGIDSVLEAAKKWVIE